MLERIGECPGQALLQPYNYTAPGFYGFRGEWPFQESPQIADYAGNAALECAYVAIVTGAPPPQGKLRISIAAASPTLQVAGTEQAVDASMIAPQSRALTAAIGMAKPKASAQSCRAVGSTPELVLSITWGADESIRSVVWKDAMNNTLTSYYIQTDQNSTAGRSEVSIQASSLPVSVHVLAQDGRHTRAQIHAGTNSTEVVVQYKYYELQRLSFDQNTVQVVATSSWCSTGVSEGEVRGLIAGIGVVGAALLVTIMLWVLWLVKWHRRSRRRRTLSVPVQGASKGERNDDVRDEEDD